MPGGEEAIGRVEVITTAELSAAQRREVIDVGIAAHENEGFRNLFYLDALLTIECQPTRIWE